MPKVRGQALCVFKRSELCFATLCAYDLDLATVLSEQLIQEVMLPGLRCLRHDLALIAPEHEEVVSSMIRDYETKLDTARPDRSVHPTPSAHSGLGVGVGGWGYVGGTAEELKE